MQALNSKNFKANIFKETGKEYLQLTYDTEIRNGYTSENLEAQAKIYKIDLGSILLIDGATKKVEFDLLPDENECLVTFTVKE